MTSSVAPAARVAVPAVGAPGLAVEEMLAAAGDDSAGAVAIFVGQVRNHDRGAAVASLAYSAHPSADALAVEIASRYAARPGIVRLGFVHRIGELVVGDLAIVAAVSAAHRAEAIQACEALVEDVKSHLPIWKYQRFVDGTDEWVGLA